MSDPSKLSFKVILLITINSIMGTGIFFLPAVGARQAGLFAIISWILMGLIAIYYSTIFGELVSRYPREGGVYEYAKEAFGFFPSFILGWITLISANITIAMLMVGAIKYVGPNLSNLVLSVISIIFVLLFNILAFKGMKTGKVMLIAFACLTLIAVLGIIIPGLFMFNPANFTDWMAHASFAALELNFSGFLGGGILIIATIFFIAETFFGWETVTFLAEQVNDPKKIMPKALVIGTITISILALLFVIASKSLIHWSVLGESLTPLSDLASVIYGPWIVNSYSILVYLAIIGSVAGWIVAAPNLLVALSKDKLFVPSFAKLHPKTGTPYKAIIFQTIVTSIIVVVGAGNYETLLHLLVPMVLILYASVIVSLIVIRKKHPSFDGYIAPGGTSGPYILMFITIGLLSMWALNQHGAIETLKTIGIFILLGIPIFLLMNFYFNPQSSVTFKNKTAYLSGIFEVLFLPKKIRARLLSGVKPHHQVLFLGAGSGILIKESYFPKENITILENSPSIVNTLKKQFPEVNIIHDEHLISRIHPDIIKADVVISVNLLSHIQDLSLHLKYLHSILPKNASICFFDYADFYKFIPNNIPPLNELRQIFQDNGFAVKIEKVSGILWTYLFVEGIKSDSTAIYI